MATTLDPEILRRDIVRYMSLREACTDARAIKALTELIDEAQARLDTA